MQCSGVVGGALGASAEREGRPLAVEVLFVREPGLVLTLHIIPFHISLTESLRIASTLIGSGRASDECEQQCSQKSLSHGRRFHIDMT